MIHFSPTPGKNPKPILRPRADSSNARISQRSRDPESPAIDANATRLPDRLSEIQRKPEALDSARTHTLGGRMYSVHESELQTLAIAGTFRAVAATDLARIGYAGDAQRMEREIHRLKEHSLLSEKTVRAGRGKTIRIFGLTKTGARLIRKSGTVPEGQTIHYGFVKPREAKHDADLYRLYHAQAERIVRAGGRPTRVLLDFELKRNLNRDLAAIPMEELTDASRERIAERHGLAVVNGRIPVPDLRVEYDTAEMQHKQLDLEWRRATTVPVRSPQKPRRGFLFTPCVRMLCGFAASSIRTKSQRRFSRYECPARSARCTPGSRLLRKRGALCLPSGYAFRIFRRPAIPRVYPLPLGETHHLVLEQIAVQPVCPDLSFRVWRHCLPLVRAKDLPANWPRTSSQPPRPRI